MMGAATGYLIDHMRAEHAPSHFYDEDNLTRSTRMNTEPLRGH